MAALGRCIDPIYRAVFNRKEEKGRSRRYLLAAALFNDFAGVFISGSFYTGFLSQNGIDIVKVGIIAFIPYITWVFGLLCPTIMHRFKRRKGILLFNHYFYYACVILATTVMPKFVIDPTARTVWFAVLLFIGNTVNALFCGGASAWHIHFVPTDDTQRTAYLSVTYLLRNATGMVVVVVASLLTDALEGSQKQLAVLTAMRYISFGLMCITGVLNYLLPPEYPYKLSKAIRLRDVMVKPVRHRYFLMCVGIIALWNMITCCNASTWSYYILNTVGIKYLLTYTGSIVTAIANPLTVGWWRHKMHQYGTLRVLMCNVMVSSLMELLIGFTAPGEYWMYVFIPVSVIQGLNTVGAQLVFGNLFYLCLPDKDTDIYSTFWSFSGNVVVLVGQLLGTGFIAWSEKQGTVPFLGMNMYGSQLLVWIKFVAFALMAYYVWHCAKTIQPQPGDAIAVDKNLPEDGEAAYAEPAGENG